MKANFEITDGQIVNFDKIIIVFNFHEINEILNQGFSFKKSKIKNKNNIVGIWNIKPKKNKVENSEKNKNFTVRDFAKKYGIEKLEGINVLRFDKKIEISIHKEDLDIDPNLNFRLSTYQGFWIYPNDLILGKPKTKEKFELIEKSPECSFVLSQFDAYEYLNYNFILVETLRKFPKCNILELEKELENYI